MKKFHEIGDVSFEKELMLLRVDGETLTFNLKEISPALFAASEIERKTFEISSSGYGIHWPLIDEDLSIDALLGVCHSPGKTAVA